eukprot:gnl/TRDRNA2_/TRDRNA2_121259_c0_seq1.p1 gnl/TRDRNA2_/TRDRNA2_121259_c0~~gnl/TRDRNA2_/TRDRNA2_121259_c0_seq1.p1  ORF type:complete len:363 (-),score=60.11 gnl/TRDRNA2_/TRDRNA2_121259_c0_seq1:104-1087(-)
MWDDVAPSTSELGYSWDPPGALPPLPCQSVLYVSVGDAGQHQIHVENNADADMATVALFDADPHYIRVGHTGRSGRKPKWQIVLEARRVRCACACSEVVVLGTKVCTGGMHSELILLDSLSGLQLLPPLMLNACASEVRVASGGRNVLVLDESGKASLYELDKSGTKLAFEAELPPLQEHPLEVTFVPGSSAPLLRLADGGAVAFHLGLRTWLALDTWRYTESALQCHMPMAPPQIGGLSERLWEWRRPMLPSVWRGVAAAEPRSGWTAHVERLMQLSHCLAATESFGSSTEVDAALVELVTYCEEVGATAVLADITKAKEKWSELK